MKQLGVYKLNKKYYIKIYGTEYELILPKEEDVKEKKGKGKTKTNKVAKVSKES